MKPVLIEEKAVGWGRGCGVAGIYLLAVVTVMVAVQGIFSFPSSEYLEGGLFLVSAVLIAALVRLYMVAVWRCRRRKHEISQVFSGFGEEEFFPLLARQLVRLTGAEGALIFQVAGEKKETLRSLGAVSRGRQLEEFEFPWAGTPYEKLLYRSESISLSHGMQERIFQAELPPELPAASFLGTPMKNVAGSTIGLLGLWDKRPLCGREETEEILAIFASRASAELERRRLEEALRKSEECFHATFDQAAIGIVHVSAEGRLLRANRQYSDIVGASLEELRRRTIAEITHPDDRAVSMDYFRRLSAGKIGNYCLEKRYLRQDGTTVWVHLTASRIADAQGKTSFFLGLVQEIGERKKAEEALRFSEARYRALYRDNPAMIFTLDAAWNILSANPMSARQLGYAVEELEGRSGLEVFYEEDRPAVAEQLRNCLKNPGQVYRWQFRKVRKDGAVLWVEEIAQGVFDPKGEENILVVCQDITERRRAKEDIEQLNADLKVRAAELENVNRELKAFNYAVAHDLRKPLTAVNGYSQLLQELCGDVLDEACSGYLQEIYQASLRMNHLTDTLLDFAHLTGVKLHRVPVDLSALAQAVAAELRVTEPQHRVVFRIAAGLSAVADAGLIRVVLENLFGNAWKYTGGEDEAIIEFGLAGSGENQAFFVRDNGVGFDMANLDKLFMPFQRLPGTEEFKGHGVGLATVERIIRRHGGRAWAEGAPGEGACFYFTLPEG